MLLSMTGYGRETVEINHKTITVEIRSLNSKYTDLRLKIPQNYREKEMFLRKKVNDMVGRGKVDLTIDITSLNPAEGLNLDLFRNYFLQLQDFAKELDTDPGDLFTALLRLQNITSGDATSIVDDQEWASVQQVIEGAFDKFNAFRKTEGQALLDDMTSRIAQIKSLLGQVEPFESARSEKLRERLAHNLEEHVGKDRVDENRFEQEILYYLEKLDITEEKVRLAQHCKYFLEELKKPTPQKGRKLNFISQEIGREINTLGAKAHSSDLQRIVVSMKDELEKIKEQVANVL